ncbi:phosphotransferase [Microlunatus soli]|uniref:Ser/Thr protein kinase RdoA involved in Cpx stress response, MazF antagonist n=1 Tax=Microlunatus soli TaxID=630515 RepID=A0A1H1V3M8_9ACTN|nr:phosphotransferase [Microlunatus soli]SDS79387.1 Ser/Thr protein kinase RdoA involved in Cpx stress response, MazF antagonist [Microlunatus soli]
MILSQQLIEFCRRRDVDLAAGTVTRLYGGEVNDNWKIERPGASAVVLRRYRQTVEPEELDCELAAADVLARSGFPTPAPIAVSGESLAGRWEMVEGRPTALFDFVDGRHPVQRPGGYGSLDLELGRAAAGLAGRMQLLLAQDQQAGHQLPGARSPVRDPRHRVQAFLDGDLAEQPVFGSLIAPLRDLNDRMASLSDDQEELPVGLIHNDISPPNLLLGDDDSIVALLDFDDSAQTCLCYELGPIISNFGKDQKRRIDADRVEMLITAYHAVRSLTPYECRLLPDLLAIHAAAEAVEVITNWLAAGRTDLDPMESYSAQQFLDLLAMRTELQSRIISEQTNDHQR